MKFLCITSFHSDIDISKYKNQIYIVKIANKENVEVNLYNILI